MLENNLGNQKQKQEDIIALTALHFAACCSVAF